MNAVTLVLLVVVADLRDTPSMISLVPRVPEQAIREECASTELRWQEQLRRHEEALQRYRIADAKRMVWEAEAVATDRKSSLEAAMAMERAHHECVDKATEARLPVLLLRAGPATDAAKLGEIQMYLGEAGLQYRYVNPSGVAIPFVPDSYDGDWGYGSIYHTALRRSGDWAQLPRRPFPEPVWLDLRDLGSSPKVIPIHELHVIHLRTVPFTGSAIVLGVDETGVRVREEIPTDMPCDEEFSPDQVEEAERQARRVTIPLRDLSDGDGHLLLSEMYSRGC